MLAMRLILNIKSIHTVIWNYLPNEKPNDNVLCSANLCSHGNVILFDEF